MPNSNIISDIYNCYSEDGNKLPRLLAGGLEIIINPECGGVPSLFKVPTGTRKVSKKNHDNSISWYEPEVISCGFGPINFYFIERLAGE